MDDGFRFYIEEARRDLDHQIGTVQDEDAKARVIAVVALSLLGAVGWMARDASGIVTLFALVPAGFLLHAIHTAAATLKARPLLHPSEPELAVRLFDQDRDTAAVLKGHARHHRQILEKNRALLKEKFDTLAYAEAAIRRCLWVVVVYAAVYLVQASFRSC